MEIKRCHNFKVLKLHCSRIRLKCYTSKKTHKHVVMSSLKAVFYSNTICCGLPVEQVLFNYIYLEAIAKAVSIKDRPNSVTEEIKTHLL